MGELKKYAKEDVRCLLVGNKSDLPSKPGKSGKPYKKGEVREVTTEYGKQFADENGMPFMESTAINRENINELFVQLAQTLLEKKPTPPEEESDIQEESATEEASSIHESSAILESSTVDIVVLDGCKKPKRRRKCC